MWVGYASINSVIINVGGEVVAKAQDGVFITNVSYVERDHPLPNEDYKIYYADNTILKSSINLEPSNLMSEISLKVSFYNSSNYDYFFDDVRYADELTDELNDVYSNFDIIYVFDNQNKVISKDGGTLDVIITFQYHNLDESTSNVLNSILNFEFVRGYNITYKNITNNGYPTTIKEGEDLDIVFSEDLPDGILLTGSTSYRYQNYNLIVNDVVCDITISDAVVFEHKGEFKFDGTNYIDTGIYLFNEENYNKNFEVSFSILDQDLSQEPYAALFNSMNENDDYFRGVVFRIDYYTKIYDFISDDEGENSTLDHKNLQYQFDEVSEVKIYRIDSFIYISINGGTLTQLRDYSNFNAYFDIPAFFGASLDSSGNPFRYYRGTLSNMKIKMLENDGIQEFDI